VKKQYQIIFLALSVCLVIFGFIYSLNSETLFGKFLDQVKPIEWNNVFPRNIIKNTIPIEILENQNGICTIKAENFHLILKAPEFTKSQDFAQELNYNNDTKTIKISCDKIPGDKLPGEKNNLHVWIVRGEAEKFSGRYQYFVTTSNVTITDAVPPQQ
jgi:hypothetical protein